MLAQHAGITQYNALMPLYMNGLKPSVRRRTMEMCVNKKPTTMEATAGAGNTTVQGLYGVALDAERLVNQIREEFDKVRPFRRVQQFNQRRDMNQLPRQQIQANAVNTQTRPGTITPEQRQQLLKEGRCFRCKQQGHIARGCPIYPNNSQLKVREIQTELTYPEPPTIARIQTSENNPFRQEPPPASPDAITNIRKLITELPVSQFDQLFDTLETEGF